MQHLTTSLSMVFSRKDARRIIVSSTLLFLLALLFLKNGGSAGEVLGFKSLPFFIKLRLMFLTFFDIAHTFTASSLILAVLGSLLGGINLALAYTYMRLRGEVIYKSGLYSGLGLFAAFLGIGCAACGTAFLSVILSFFGFSAMLGRLPYEGQEIGYIGLFILCIATYSLSQKVSRPNVC